MRSARLQRLGDLGLRGFIVLASMWTFFSVFMLLAKVLSDSKEQHTFDPAESFLELPVVSPELLVRETPGVESALAEMSTRSGDLSRAVGAPVRFGIVFQNDSSSFLELTFVSECACPASKANRFEITRELLDPITGRHLAQLKSENLSAEGVTQFLGAPPTKWRNDQ